MGEPVEHPIIEATYQPELRDIATVAVRASPHIAAAGKKNLFAALIFVLVYVGLVWFSLNEGDLMMAFFYSFLGACFGLFFGLRGWRMQQIVIKKTTAALAKRKNVSLAVPTTVRLFPGYIESASTLGCDRSHWAVIESIGWQSEYLLINAGLKTYFVPGHAFASPQDAEAFTNHALRLWQDSRDAPVDLTCPAPWSNSS